MCDERDLVRLIAALNDLAPSIRKSTDRAWSRPPAVRVIDCILSLNRDYDRFVVKRLDQFEHAHPNVQSITDLQALIAKFPSPHAFVKAVLNYNHEERANTLNAVVSWLGTMGGTAPPEAQLSKIKSWATSAHPTDYKSLRIRGFALAGFQYLRMLFGANTTKPDIYICRFVACHIGRRVSSIESLRLLERAASKRGLSLRDLDTTIWENGARGRKDSGCANHMVNCRENT
jgi:hypothetical protein